MKYESVLTGKFKRGLKLAKKRGLNISLLEDIVILTLTLIATGTHADLFDE